MKVPNEHVLTDNYNKQVCHFLFRKDYSSFVLRARISY